MSRSERRKGQDGERAVARIVNAAGFKVTRTPDGGGFHVRGDLYGDVPALIEVKRQERLQLKQWIAETAAVAEPGEMPVVAWRQSHGEWRADLPLEDLVSLMWLAAVREREATVASEATGAPL